MTADNVNIIFWGVGNILAVDMVCKPPGGYSHGWAAILNEYAVVTLHPGRTLRYPGKTIDDFFCLVLDI